MQKIKVAFKVLNSKSKTEKILIRIINETVVDVSLDKQLIRNPLTIFRYLTSIAIIQSFTQAHSVEEQNHSFQIFNSYLRNARSWIPALKILYISHELINNVGAKFCASFMSEYFEKIPEMLKGKQDVGEYVHAILAANYYNFLIMYAKYFPDIQAHLHKDLSKQLEGLQNGQYSGIVQLVSFKNIIKYFTKVEECIQGSVNVLKEDGVIFKIKEALVRDVAILNNLISKNLRYLMPHIFNLDDFLAILLDDLYSDTILITKKLKQVLSTEDLSRFNMKPFDYFEFDPEFNQKEELYILNLKKQRTKQGKIPRNDPHFIYMYKYQTLTPGKKLYKMNTRGDQFAAVNDAEDQNLLKAPEGYFNLASPDPSHLDEESSPVKLVANNDESQESGENDKKTNSSQGILLLTETDAQTYKDITPLRMELTKKYEFKDSPMHMNTNSLKKLEFGEPDRPEPGSVIFSPTTKTLMINPNEGGFNNDKKIGNNNQQYTSIFSADTKSNSRKLNLNMNNY